MSQEPAIHTGGCLCGAVRYELRGPLRGVVNCHCSKCRRFHGHHGAYTSVPRENFRLVEERGLKWYLSTQDETPGVRRGFCQECGSSLFWDAPSRPTLAIAAGSLDQPSGLATLANIWLSQRADYYQITDGLPCHPEGFPPA